MAADVSPVGFRFMSLCGHPRRCCLLAALLGAAALAASAPAAEERHPAKSGSAGARALRKAEAKDFLSVHNAARATVGVRPLRWSARVAAHAQRWAEHLAAIDRLKHRPAPRLYGENLAAASRRKFTTGDAARLWLRERGRYRARFLTGGWRTGHYTQMVWRTSTEVGCGIARAADGTVYVVANYSPPGNIFGQSAY